MATAWRSCWPADLGPLRCAFRIYLPADLTFSGLERRFLAAVREAGLPFPAANVAVNGFMLDAYWPELRFAVELDAYETHGTRLSRTTACGRRS